MPRRMSPQGAARRMVPWRARAAGTRAYKGVGRIFDFEVVKRGPSSVIPEVPPSGDASWERPSELPGVELDLDRQIDFIEAELRPYIEEFAQDVRAAGFELWNGLYQAGDAEVLYATVRHLKPARILEVGSGNSTLVNAAACAANAREGRDTELIAIDPEPRTPLQEIAGLAALERADCRAVGMERYLELGPGDVLFIDTTHIVKLGGEVNWLILEILPRLRPGVWVHIHDIYLPYEYPRYIIKWGGYYSEQYLVQGFLAGNVDWEVQLALAALYRDRHEGITELIPSLRERVPNLPGLPTWLPAAFWIRRRS